jgi:ribonuclease HII
MPRLKKNTNLFGLDAMPETPDDIDKLYKSRGYKAIAGIDEAGRGALAGPVSAAAVILGNIEIPDLNDSKKVTPENRDILYDRIFSSGALIGVALVGPGRIDEINILQAALEAMAFALLMLKGEPDIVLIDGNQVPKGIENGVPIVKGDLRSKCIMAASIIAKVTRDRFMVRLSKQFPGFDFEIHKGYAVPAHYKAISEHGLTHYHRLSFQPCGDICQKLPCKTSNSKIAEPFLWERL